MADRLLVDMCVKSFGAYGACVLDKGHADELCEDAFGYRFIGGVLCELVCGGEGGCVAPDVHVKGRPAPGGAGRPKYTDVSFD